MKCKLITVVTAWLMLCASSRGEETWEYLHKVWKNPDTYLQEIHNQITFYEPDDYEKDKKLSFNLQNFAFAINQEIIKADSPNWATPSPERKAAIDKWGNILKPYTADLVKLALDKDTRYTGAGRQSRSLLDFAAPTEEFADQVRHYLRKGQGGADLLYEHRLLTDTDKEVMRQLRPAENQEHQLENWAIGLSVFGMPDGLEIAKKALSKEPHGETPEEITNPYLRFLRMANNLGSDAAVLLPEIEKLIAHPKIISSGYQKNFEYTRDVITGKEPRQERYAINGSGPISPWLVDPNLKRQKMGNSSERLPAPKKSAGQKQVPSILSKELTSSTLWPVVAVLVLAALGVLWLLFKKRK